eukprot:7685148-Pyramimonas_sp.AAC.1
MAKCACSGRWKPGSASSSSVVSRRMVLRQTRGTRCKITAARCVAHVNLTTPARALWFWSRPRLNGTSRFHLWGMLLRGFQPSQQSFDEAPRVRTPKRTLLTSPDGENQQQAAEDAAVADDTSTNVRFGQFRVLRRSFLLGDLKTLVGGEAVVQALQLLAEKGRAERGVRA